MSGYAEPVRSSGVIDTLTAADIDTLFKRTRGWFDHTAVRRRLYAKGFPHPCERARWSTAAVASWMATAGNNPDAVPPPPGSGTPKKRRRRGGRGNAYAVVQP